ncbi:hypothetical protein DQG13_16180 [Paenibacillus sp. YN15]|nr:hypothetical protein DQG13_16180 [Paenibacillus sp. YN15]
MFRIVVLLSHKIQTRKDPKYAVLSKFGIISFVQAWWAVGYPLEREVMPVEIKDALALMISFATLIVLVLSFHNKK